MKLYAQSWEQVCNSALGLLGAHEISALDDGTESARICSTYLPDAIESVLSQWDWKSCRKRMGLHPAEQRPEFGYEWQFPLPTDFIRLVEVQGYVKNEDKPPYVIEGGFILADTGSLQIVYIARPQDPARLISGLRRAIYTELAALIATALVSNEQLISLVLQQAARAVALAQIEDAQLNYDPFKDGIDWYEEARR